MGLFFSLFLPLLGRALAPGKAVAASIWLYAVGQAVHAIGLFWAGGYGAPRKTVAAADGAQALGPTIGLYMLGVGAVIAVIGGVTFIVLVARALLKSR
jgi:heme/copper-type cytochrome/quinol oxidase subunit 1